MTMQQGLAELRKLGVKETHLNVLSYLGATQPIVRSALTLISCGISPLDGLADLSCTLADCFAKLQVQLLTAEAGTSRILEDDQGQRFRYDPPADLLEVVKLAPGASLLEGTDYPLKDQFMRKTYENPVFELTIPTGEVGYATVPFPASALIKKLVVAQISGEAVGFTVDVYNSNLAIPDENGDSQLTDDRLPLYQVMDQMEAAAGDSVQMFNPNGYSYRNCSPESTPSNNLREVYVRIEPLEAGGETSFGIVLGGEPATAN